MNPKLAYPSKPEYFRKNYRRFKPGEYVYAFESIYGKIMATGRLKSSRKWPWERFPLLSDERDESYIKGFRLNSVKRNEIVYFIEPDKEHYYPDLEEYKGRSEPKIVNMRKNMDLLPMNKVIEICRDRNWSHLPLLYEGSYNPDFVVNLNHGPSRLNDKVDRLGVLLVNDDGLCSYIPNIYSSGNTGFKQWVRVGGYRR